MPMRAKMGRFCYFGAKTNLLRIEGVSVEHE